MRWFLFMTGEEGMRKGATPKAAAPATVTGEVARGHWSNPGRRATVGGNLCIRKPGDLPARD